MADPLETRVANLEGSMVAVLNQLTQFASKLTTKQTFILLESRLNELEAALNSLKTRVELLENK